MIASAVLALDFAMPDGSEKESDPEWLRHQKQANPEIRRQRNAHRMNRSKFLEVLCDSDYSLRPSLCLG